MEKFVKKILALFGIKNKSDFWTFLLQFFKFGIVGISNTIVFLVVYYALVLLGVHHIIANIIAFPLGVLNAFFWNRKFVFKQEKNRPVQLAKVFAAYGITFALSTGGLFLMVDVFGLSAFVAPLINICVTTPINFLLNKFWAFR